MPTLHGCYRSRASRNIWLAYEIGMDLTLRNVWQAYRLDDPESPGAPLNTRSPEFLALSPMGAIPVLEDDGLVLTESLAINLYLARWYGGVLGPRDEAENAMMMQWALFGATSVEQPALAIQNVHQYGQPRGERGRAEIGQALEKLRRPLNALEAHLAREEHLVGGRFTVADINMAEMLRYGQPEAGFLAPYPATEAWLAACQSRPAFRRMWDRRQAEPVRP